MVINSWNGTAWVISVNADRARMGLIDLRPANETVVASVISVQCCHYDIGRYTAHCVIGCTKIQRAVALRYSTTISYLFIEPSQDTRSHSTRHRAFYSIHFALSLFAEWTLYTLHRHTDLVLRTGKLLDLYMPTLEANAAAEKKTGK